ncbi:hypothetical protein Acit_10240 [Aciditerrimonas ferrireducens]|nr:hypothetical protein [Aciditerrimonas ferrireducens]MCK4177820.1 hypothetical protein [Aciditerrimonas ferrireducens]
MPVVERATKTLAVPVAKNPPWRPVKFEDRKATNSMQNVAVGMMIFHQVNHLFHSPSNRTPKKFTNAKSTMRPMAKPMPDPVSTTTPCRVALKPALG